MSTKRASLRDRQNQAIADTGTGTAAATSPGVQTRLGTYWQLGTFEEAKRAYLADLDTQPDSPGSFAGWIDRAITRHARLTPERREEIARSLGTEPKDGRGASRSFHVATATVEAMEAGIIEDRKNIGRVTSRTAFVADAVREGIKEARKRYGADLPIAPARLPNNPPRG